MHTRLLVCFYILFTSQLLRAQEMSLDRPDQTDGASTVNPHVLQLESELFFDVFKDKKAALITSTLFRYGLIKNLELRLIADQGLHRHRFLSETAQGYFPVATGLKFTLLKGKNDLPDIGILAHVQLPFTNRAEESHYWSPAFALALEEKLGRWNLSTNEGFKHEAFEHEWVWQFSGDVKYKVSKRVEVFTEYYTQISHSSPNQNIDAGLLVHLAKKWMIYAAAGDQLFTHNGNYFINTGFAVQLL